MVAISARFNLLKNAGFRIHLRGEPILCGVQLTVQWESAKESDHINDPAQSQQDHVMGIPSVPQPSRLLKGH